MKKKGLLKIFLITMLISSLLTGCSLGRSDEETKKFDNLWNTGTIDYEESTLGISLNTKDITDVLTDGMFYVCHNDILYPLYEDYQTYTEIEKNYPEQNHYMVYNSETIINVPTLFEGDKLYYFSKNGIIDYFQVERYKDLGWSIGLRNLESTTSQKHIYLNLDNDRNGLTILSNEFYSLNQITDTTLLLDKIGGVRITPEFVEDGIVVGLTPGANYDVEIYNGTKYYYYNADCNVRYFKAMELYALDEYEPLQDYLYEIEIPEYLLDGYYNFNGIGLLRYVRGTQYDDFTDFNQKLLYQYTKHTEGDDSLKEKEIPLIYSSNSLLNKFTAYDESCFGYIDKEEIIEEEPEIVFEKLNYFQQASTKEIELWFPKDKECYISIESEETTGSIYLVMENGSRKKLNHNRLNKVYELLVTGKDFKATLEIQGFYQDYKVILTNAESYKGQDKTIVMPEEETTKNEK